MVPTDKSSFTLRRATGTFADGAAKLAGEIGSTAVEAVLAQANRVAVRRGNAAALGTMQPRPADWYAFDAKDNDTADWYPQGLSCGEDSGNVGVPVFLVSWYFKPEAPAVERGIRVSFLNPQSLKYQHALLIDARPDGSYGPINIHAGGVAWYGDLLYVADTFKGLRVFDLNQLLDLRTAQSDLGDAKLVGRQGGKFHAFGYRYLLPQTDSWRVGPGGRIFSFVSVDRSAQPDLLVAGEYDGNGPDGRIARWNLGPGGLEDGTPVDAFVMGRPKIQGGMSFKGKWYLSQAADARTNGKLVVTEPGGKAVTRPFPLGPEDLCVQGGKLWSVTEFRNKRVIFGVGL